MKNLKTIRKHKSTEEGFSLVIATGFGLVIMLIGLTIMGRSMKDSSVSASQKTITRSLAAAESGVTQYLSFMNQNRLAANVPDCVARGADGTCNDTSTTASWANPSGISATDIPTVESTILANSQQSWRNVVPSDPTKGQYRLLRYQPPGSGGTPGVLKVEGRVNQQGSGSTATNDVQTGKTRLQVNISVTPSNIPDVPFPGIWLNNGTGSIGQDFQANGLLSNTNPTALGLYVQPNYPSGTPETAPRTSIDMARFLPPQPSSSSFLNSNLTDRLNAGNVSLPATGDRFTTETIDGVLMNVYRYPSGNLTAKSNIVVNTVNSAVTSGGTIRPQKVIVYLDGDIDLQGNGEITHQCKKTDGSAASNCDLNNFQIYGYNSNPISQTRKICTHGSHKIDGFIIAPTYTAGSNASGNGKGGFKGAVWVNNWGGACANTSSNQLVITQNGNWGEVVPFLTPQTFPPKIGVIGNQAISTD